MTGWRQTWCRHPQFQRWRAASMPCHVAIEALCPKTPPQLWRPWAPARGTTEQHAHRAHGSWQPMHEQNGLQCQLKKLHGHPAVSSCILYQSLTSILRSRIHFHWCLSISLVISFRAMSRKELNDCRHSCDWAKVEEMELMDTWACEAGAASWRNLWKKWDNLNHSWDPQVIQFLSIFASCREEVRSFNYGHHWTWFWNVSNIHTVIAAKSIHLLYISA